MDNEKDIRELLKRAMPSAGRAELQRDLWPLLLRRLDERPGRMPWFDWALLAALAACAVASPGLLPILLYHL